MSGNTLGLLLSVIQLLEEADLSVWVFGGWAEELWQLTPTRTHNDIDLLYPSATFDPLDRLIAGAKDFREITTKRFSHKRAVLYQQVMIEFFLVQSAHANYFTDFFSGRYHLVWPDNLFDHRINISGCSVPIVSKQALVMYRQHHEQMELAYRSFVAAS